MGYDTKSILELEEIAEHLREQLRHNPDLVLERVELFECETWITELKRQCEGQWEPNNEVA